jgi:nucleoside-diphosphate-sugar epimerase
MRIVITGASGNIGTATLRRLGGEGHDLVGLARRAPEPDSPSAAVRWAVVDLTEDSCLPALRSAFEGADAVVHLAWGFQPSHDERYLRELGVGGTRRVLEAVTGARVPHLVHMSSMGAYSPKRDDTPVNEGWPTLGVPTSRYSVHKVAAERLLDAHENAGHETVISRMRPGIVGQRSAGSALLRYGVPALVPAALLDHVPVLPLDRRLAVPMVHADDVADAIARELDRRIGGAFNLAADPPITTDRIARALGARAVHVPSSVLRPLMSAAWHARVQQVDTGWLDLAFALPLLDSSRARGALGWSPSVDAESVLREVLTGMRDGASGGTPVLRPRRVLGALRDGVFRGPVGRRSLP